MTNYKIKTVKQLLKETEHDNHKFVFVSLFAGGGGSSTGYRMAGGKSLLINEFVQDAANTYQANWKNTKILTDDVKKITGAQILKEINMKKGELDLLDGSPPCSAFSVAGTRDKNWGKTKTYSDTKQEKIEDLFFEYIRIIKDIMPKVFVAENVAGLSMGKAKGYLNEILRKMRDAGYHVECKKLDAKWLGVPQSRNRLIFVGIRNDLFRPGMSGCFHPKPFTKTINLKQAFKGLTFTDTDRTDTYLKQYKIYQYLKYMKEGEQHDKRFNLIKASRNSVCPCITATSACLSAAAPKHWDNRGFTVAETKRIMSVPDDYILTGSYVKQIERLGRMVAPLMMKGVADAILKTGIFNHENT